MKKTIEERREYAKIIAQAWVDEEFKKRLLDDPAGILQEINLGSPKIDMRVSIGDREIRDFVIETLKAEMDRQGLGHGDRMSGLAYV